MIRFKLTIRPGQHLSHHDKFRNIMEGGNHLIEIIEGINFL
jgi:hypothetical protein